jgi:hypothetical protein
MRKSQAITQRRRGAKRKEHLSTRQVRRKAAREAAKKK